MDQSKHLSARGDSSRLLSGVAVSSVKGILLHLECSLPLTAASLSDHRSNYEETLSPVSCVRSHRFMNLYHSSGQIYNIQNN